MVIGSESIPGIRGIFQKLGIPKIGKKNKCWSLNSDFVVEWINS